MVHAIPEGIIRVNEGDTILSLPMKRAVKQTYGSLIYLYRPKIPSVINGPSGGETLFEAYLNDPRYVRTWEGRRVPSHNVYTSIAFHQKVDYL